MIDKRMGHCLREAAGDNPDLAPAYESPLSMFQTISQVSLQDRQLTCDTQINDVQTQGQVRPRNPDDKRTLLLCGLRC